MTKRRVNIPVTEETRAALQSLADVRRSSLAAVCEEMLDQVAPIAAQMAEALKTAQEAPARALLMVKDTLEAQMLQADQYLLDIDEKVTPKTTRRKYVVKKRKTG